MHSKYLVVRISGSLCFILAFALTLLLQRGEPFVPLTFAGIGLVALSESWKNLRIRKLPVALRAEKQLIRSITILSLGVFVSFFAAIVGTVLTTGFTIAYAPPLLAGMTIIIVGILLAAWGTASARSAIKRESQGMTPQSAGTNKSPG
jgi:hypothetical protein